MGKLPAPSAGVGLEIRPAQELEQVEATIVMPGRRDVAHAPQRAHSIQPQSAEFFPKRTKTLGARSDTAGLQVAPNRLDQPRNIPNQVGNRFYVDGAVEARGLERRILVEQDRAAGALEYGHRFAG